MNDIDAKVKAAQPNNQGDRFGLTMEL